MIFLTVEEIIMLHEKLLVATGGTPGLRDRGLLESTVFGINAGFDDVGNYPTVEERAARLAFSLVCNHAFVDGNKRVGVLAMLMTLSLNKAHLCYTQEELISLSLHIADGPWDYSQALQWVKEKLDQ